MSIIRLKVKVLPWRNPITSIGSASRQEDIKTWIEPCAEDVTISALHERILDSFADLHGGKGELCIKWLEDDDGNALRGHLRVGEAFRESREISDRTVKVVRLPPTEKDLSNPERFASIAPESTARPQKRTQFQEQIVRNSLLDLVSAEDWSVRAPRDGYERPYKRQRTGEVGSGGNHDRDQPLPSSEGVDEVIYQRSGLRNSQRAPVHQVDDSQRSPARKQHNPYGTPTSLTVYSPLNPVSSSQPQIIPESPEQRGLNHNVEPTTGIFVYDRPKSESPELVPSVHEFPSSSAVTGTSVTSTQQRTEQDPTARSIVQDAARENNADTLSGERIEKAGPVDLQGPKAPSVELRQSPFAGHSSSKQGPLGNEKTLTELRRRISNPPDPIESDADVPQEHQHARNDEQPQVPQPPVRIAVSGIILSPSHSNSPIRDDVLGGTSLSEIGDKPSQGPQLLNGGDKSASAIKPLHSYSSAAGTKPESTIVTPSVTNVQPASQESNVVDLEEDIEEQSDIILSCGSMAKQERQPHRSEPAHGFSAVNTDSTAPNEADTERLQQSSEGNHPLTQLASTVQEENTLSQEQRKAHSGVSSAKTLERERSLEARTDRKRKALTEPTKSDLKPSPEESSNMKHPSSRDDNYLANEEELAVTSRSAGATREPKDSELDAFNVPDSEPDANPPKSKLTKRAVSKKVEKSVAQSKSEADRQTLEQEKRDLKNARARQRRAEKKAQLAKSTDLEKRNTAEVVDDQPDDEIRETSTRSTTKKRRVTESEAVEEPSNKSSRLSRGTAGRKAIAGKTASQPESVESQSDQEIHELSKRDSTKKKRVADTQAAQETKNGGKNLSEGKPGRKAIAGKAANQQAEGTTDEAETIALGLSSGQRHGSKTPARTGLQLKAGAGSASGAVQKIRESADTESTRSSSHSNRHKASATRRSMTPMFPASSAAKPIKSALRTSESGNRRSVSFNDEAIIAPDALVGVTSKASKPAKNSDMSKPSVANKATKTASSSTGSNGKIAPSTSKESQERRKVDSLSNAQALRIGPRKSETPSKGTESNPKVQTKLNVTRDVKLKGRAIDPPSLPRKTSTQAKSEEIVISSESERSASTYYSDEEDRVREPKAGPSQRKNSHSSLETSNKPNRSNVGIPTKSPDPPKSSDKPKVNIKREISATPPPRHPSPERSRAMSKSRSPAQYMSRAGGSISSRSGSEEAASSSSRTASASGDDSTSHSDGSDSSGSSSEDETASEDEPGDHELSPQEADETRKRKNSHSKTRHNGNTKQTRLSPTTQQQQQKEPSPPPQLSSEGASSSQSSSSSSSSEEEEEEDLAGQQLHRESHQSLQLNPTPQQPKKKRNEDPPPLPTSTSTTTSKSRFPTLSTLREQGRAPQNNNNTPLTSHRTPIIPDGDSYSSSSDDDDDDSTSTSESESDINNEDKAQSKKGGGVMKGLRGVIK
ncbi:MAG: hypothetical protein Q9191_006412, partial [Dirinaria sp. TL-2023a]